MSIRTYRYTLYIYISLECKYVRIWAVKQVALFPCAGQVDVSNPRKTVFVRVPFCSLFFMFGATCTFHNRVALGRDMLYCCTWYVFICIQRTAAVAAAALCCYTADAAAAAAAAVRHRVPDGKICYWFIESDPSVFFVLIQNTIYFNAPFGSTVAFTASICLHPR